ncbi:DUF262 domain-containing protein [Isoptericola croceus]|uniref:DUF262 domain-containing protein n=1 Tax=Isoptericola croceus TaxID=3031406 RepID=UPI0023F8C4D5|nr:DUF262 domain-containing protein [Isoptericola croceus]
MDFDQGPIGTHLALQAQQYIIPDFQRSYSWKRAEWRTLWVDIMRQYKEAHPGWSAASADADIVEKVASIGHVPTHYLGTIVTANPVTVTPPRSSVIDGQQRLVSSWLLLLACRDLAVARLGKSDYAAESRTEVDERFKSYLFNSGHTGKNRWRIIPQRLDEAAFRHLMLETREPGKVKVENIGLGESDSTSVIEAFNYFLAEMRRQSLPASAPFEMADFAPLYPLDVDLLEYVIMNRLFAIKLIAGPTDDPNMIFESLNTKGRDLQQVDLIKNFLYLSLGSDADEVYSSYWQPMENSLRPEELERFAWASLVSRGSNVLQKRTYEEVQRSLRKKGVAGTRAYVVELSTEAVWFERLLRIEKEPNPVVRRALDDVYAAGGVTALPLILYCYRRYMQENDAAAFRDALFEIESFLVRRMVAGDGTNNLNSMFGLMCSRINGNLEFDSQGSLVEDIRAVMSYKPADWSDDKAVRQGVLDVDFYHSQKPRQRIHVLRRIDQYAGSSGVALQYEESDKSIEHIAPQSIDSPEWIEVLSPDGWEAVRERLHTLPNLTLLTPSENSRAGRRSWVTKREIYSACDYPVTKAVAAMFESAPLFGEAELDERAASLTDVICAIWPRNVLAVGASSSPGAVEIEEFSDDDSLDQSLLDTEIRGGD